MTSDSSDGRTLPNQPPAVELRGITKRFPGVVANSDVNLTVRPGEVHAVVGENGAGKSTLMKTLYGMHQPDEGQILVQGNPHRLRNPREAIAAGIGMVHQHFMLAENLTVLENVVLGAEPRKGLRLDLPDARRRLREVSDRYGLDLDPGALIETLSVAQRQRVEIAKVLFRGARVLILDEPTAVLVPQEVDELFSNLTELRDRGLAVIFISHKLDEVLAVADTITVIRRGTTVATLSPEGTTPRDLAELMVGTELPAPGARTAPIEDTVALAVDGLTVLTGTGLPRIHDVSFRVRRGEIAGFAGVEGNGQSELVQALIGLLPAAGGTITLAAQDITAWSVLRRREAGIAYIPEDRHRQGMVLSAALWENRLLGRHRHPAFSRAGWIRRRAARADTARLMADYDVRAPGPDTTAGALSGGNQQKLIVGRELSQSPRALLAAHPTRGVDIGAQAGIWDRLRRARDNGLATVLVSADLEELIGLSDTLYVLLRGRVTARLDPARITPEILGSYMTGARSAAGPDAGTVPGDGEQPGGSENSGPEATR
jgi:general nucleoside transport system ATP-binding protein